MDGIAHDQIFLILPDGREVIGRALKVNDPIKIDGGPGRVDARFLIDASIPQIEICVVLMKIDKPIRERITI